MPSPSARLSASCKEIAHEDFSNPSAACITVRCNLADSDISPVVDGHIINGIPLVPSGLYGDMAQVVAKYIWKRLRPEDVKEKPAINVCDMHVDKTFIPAWPAPVGGEWFEMEAVANLTPAPGEHEGTISCTFRKPDDPKLKDYAGCTVKYQHAAMWQKEWSRYEHIIAGRIQHLLTRARVEASGNIRVVQREQAYERFKTFVDYSIPEYQNMREAVMDYENLEATAALQFRLDPARGEYAGGAYYMDGSCHLSGWVCNESDADMKKNAYISHGWGAMKLSPEFDPACRPEAEYRSYVRMVVKGEKQDVLGGDVFILEGDRIVGVWGGVEFKRIPRRVLNVFLPPRK